MLHCHFQQVERTCNRCLDYQWTFHYSQPTATIASIGDTEMNVPLTCLQTVLLLKSLK